MRILVGGRGVVPLGPRVGGAEQAAYQLAKAVCAEGHTVDLVTDVADDSVEVPPGLQLKPLASRGARLTRLVPSGFVRWLFQHLFANISVARRVLALARSGEYDVVHLHGALAALIVARFTSLPVVYTEHDATPWSCRYRRWWVRVIRRAVYRVVNVAAFRAAERVVPVFDALGTEIAERWGLHPRKIIPITNGTDVDFFNPVRPGTTGPLDGAGSGDYCLFVGKLEPRKAPDLLLHALAEVDDLRCVFAGDGPLRRKLERLAQQLGLADRVVFLGNVPQSELARLYAEAMFFVLPSVSEATPLVIVEAMACGTPVLASRISGTPGLVRDWETGFLVKPSDVGQLAMGMRFLSGDAGLRARMSENARQLIYRDFAWPVLGRKYVALYGELARGGRLPHPVADVREAPVSVSA